MTLGAPQIITCCLILLNMGVALARYGEPKKPDEYDLIDLLIGPALSVGLLYWGGFFGTF